jgi:hypothetical protein
MALHRAYLLASVVLGLWIAANPAISASRLAAQLAKAYATAEAAKRPADMVNATIAQAKLAGMWTERSQVTANKGTELDLDRLTDEEKAALDEGISVLTPLLEKARVQPGEPKAEPQGFARISKGSVN